MTFSTFIEPKMHYHIYEIPPLEPNLSQMHRVSLLPCTLIVFNYRNILHTMPRVSDQASAGFPAKCVYASVCSSCVITCPAHLILRDLVTVIMFVNSRSFEAPH